MLYSLIKVTDEDSAQNIGMNRFLLKSVDAHSQDDTRPFITLPGIWLLQQLNNSSTQVYYTLLTCS